MSRSMTLTRHKARRTLSRRRSLADDLSGNRMSESESNEKVVAAEEIFLRVEQSLAPGPVRDTWRRVQSEMAEGGPDAVRTLLETEFEKRHGLLLTALQELSINWRTPRDGEIRVSDRACNRRGF